MNIPGVLCRYRLRQPSSEDFFRNPRALENRREVFPESWLVFCHCLSPLPSRFFHSFILWRNHIFLCGDGNKASLLTTLNKQQVYTLPGECQENIRNFWEKAGKIVGTDTEPTSRSVVTTETHSKKCSSKPGRKLMATTRLRRESSCRCSDFQGGTRQVSKR